MIMSDDDLLDELLDRWEAFQDEGCPLQELLPAVPERLLDEFQRRRMALQRMDPFLENAPAPTQDWEEGFEPFPGYRLVRPIARGGSSEVWEAVGPGGLPLALKLIPNDHRGVTRTELGSIEAVRHPHLLAVNGAWTIGDGTGLAEWNRDASNAGRAINTPFCECHVTKLVRNCWMERSKANPARPAHYRGG